MREWELLLHYIYKCKIRAQKFFGFNEVIQGRLSDLSSHALTSTLFISSAKVVSTTSTPHSTGGGYTQKNNGYKKHVKKVVLSCHITMKLTQPPCFFMKKETAVVNHDNFISIRIFRNSHTTCNLGRYHGGGGCAFEAFFRDHVHITLFTNFHAN